MGVTAVGLVALAVSLGGLGNQLVQDDISLLVESDRLHGLSRWSEILTSSYWPPPRAPELWRPVTSLLLAFEYGLGGGAPWVFRLGSYLLYAVAAILVYRLAGRVLSPGFALVAGLIFAAHPVHVEAVALATGQGELLVGIFGAAMVLVYLGRRGSGPTGVRPDGKTGGGLRGRDWLWLGVLYLAAGLSKEHGLVLPALLIAVELTLVKDSGENRRRLLPGYAGLIALGVLVMLTRRMILGGDLVGTFAAPPLDQLGMGGRALLMLGVAAHWARLLVWPFHLQADYSPGEIEVRPGLAGIEILGFGIVLGAILVAWTARRKIPLVTFSLGWIAIALLPVSNILIPTGILVAERTLFLPSVGLVLLVGGALSAAGKLPRVGPVPLGLAAGGAILVLGWRSAERQRAWRDDATYRIQGAQDAPRSWRAQLSYASWLFEAGQRDSALVCYRLAVEYAPARERWKVHNDLAEELLAVGAAADAVEQLRLSLALAPEQESTRHDLVLGLLTLGDYAGAAAAADSAMTRGGSREVFEELRVWADSARRLGLPPGAVRIRVRSPEE
jgi:hypothetical protein